MRKNMRTMRKYGSGLSLLAACAAAVFLAVDARAQEEAGAPAEEKAAIETAPLSADKSGRLQSRAHYMNALYRLYRGDALGARDAVNKAIQLANESGNESARLYAYAGQIYRVGQSLRRANEMCRKAISIDPNCAHAYYVMGRAALDSGQNQSAFEMFQKASDADPSHILSLEMVGRLANYFNRSEQAIEAFEALTHMRPLDASYRLQLGDLYERAQRFPLAIQEYERAAQINSNWPSPFLNLAELHKKLKNFETAAENYEAYIKLYPNYDQVRTLVGLYAQMKQFDKALETLKRYVEIDPESIEARLALGGYCLAAERYDEALSHIREAIRLDSNIAEAHAMLGRYHLVASDDPVKALESYTAALQIDNDNADALFGLAMTYGRMGDLNNALLTLQTILKNNPANLHAVEQMSMIYAENDTSPSDAAEMIRGAIESVTGLPTQLSPAILNTVGFIYADKGLHLDGAVALIQKALEAEPANPAYLDSLGWAYYRQSRYDEAAVYLKRAADAAPDNAVILDHLGDAYLKVDQADAAVASWKSALEFDPGNAEIEAKVRQYAKDETSERSAAE